jgi:hypothetical protein
LFDDRTFFEASRCEVSIGEDEDELDDSLEEGDGVITDFMGGT